MASLMCLLHNLRTADASFVCANLIGTLGFVVAEQISFVENVASSDNIRSVFVGLPASPCMICVMQDAKIWFLSRANSGLPSLEKSVESPNAVRSKIGRASC